MPSPRRRTPLRCLLRLPFARPKALSTAFASWPSLVRRLQNARYGLVAALVLTWNAHAASLGKVANFRLLDQEGHSHELYRDSYARAIVLVAQGNACPIVRRYFPTIKALRERFASKGVVFLMINAFDQDTRPDIAREAKDYAVDIPILKDETQFVSESLGLTRTAEAIVINPKRWEIVYDGPIDDRLSYGSQAARARKEYLADALDSFLAGHPAPPADIEARGCFINYNRSQTISYVKDVAPILKAKCLSCHASDQAEPPIHSYAQVKAWVPMIREVLMTARMPPWQADPLYGKFKNDISLSAEESRTLLQWLSSGALKDGTTDPLQEVTAVAQPDWPFGKPDMILSMPKEEKVPADGFVYKYIPLGPITEKDLWARSIVVRPGNSRVVHHAAILVLSHPFKSYSDPSMAVQETINLGKRIGLAHWLPGAAPVVLPDGYALFIPKGSYIVLEMHYNGSGREETDRTSIGFYLYPNNKTPKQVYATTIYTPRNRIQIPPGAKDYAIQTEIVIPKSVTALYYMIHMHYRGSSGRLLARYPDGTQETLLSVPQYDFNWQHRYALASPKVLPAGTKLTLEGVFDNSVQNPKNPDPNRLVRWGLSTDDEMLNGGVFGY